MLERISFGGTRCHVVIDFLLVIFVAQASGSDTLPNPVLESSTQPEVESQSNNTTTQTAVENTESESNTSIRITEASIISSTKSESKVASVDQAITRRYIPTKSGPYQPSNTILPFGRKQVLDIFPRKNHEDPYSPTIFHNFTGFIEKRVYAKAGRNIDALIKKLNFRGFIREINAYFRKIPFEQHYKTRDQNTDGLFYRAGFYLLLRALRFTPTDYFQDLWEAYGVLAVETSPTVFLFAVELSQEVQHNFKIVENIVEGKSGEVLPRDTKTILCAGITIDRDFDCKIRHWKAVLRDKTKVQNSTEVDTSSTSEEKNE